MIEKSDIYEVKKNIQDCVGQRVLLRGNKGRNQIFETEGTLTNTYANVFNVKMDNSEREVSYSYIDVLTKSIELGVNVDGNYNSILNSIDTQIIL